MVVLELWRFQLGYGALCVFIWVVACGVACATACSCVSRNAFCCSWLCARWSHGVCLLVKPHLQARRAETVVGRFAARVHVVGCCVNCCVVRGFYRLHCFTFRANLPQTIAYKQQPCQTKSLMTGREMFQAIFSPVGRRIRNRYGQKHVPVQPRSGS